MKTLLNVYASLHFYTKTAISVGFWITDTSKDFDPPIHKLEWWRRTHRHATKAHIMSIIHEMHTALPAHLLFPGDHHIVSGPNHLLITKWPPKSLRTAFRDFISKRWTNQKTLYLGSLNFWLHSYMYMSRYVSFEKKGETCSLWPLPCSKLT